MQLYTINATCERPEFDKYKQELYHDRYAGNVSDVLSRFGIDGFTMQEVLGYWQGVPEKSYIITVATDNEGAIDKICERLRSMYNQDAVMVTYPDNSVKFIERP